MLPPLPSSPGASGAHRTPPPGPAPRFPAARTRTQRRLGGRATVSAAAHSSSFAAALLDGRGVRLPSPSPLVPPIPGRRCRGNGERVGWTKVRRQAWGGRRAGSLSAVGPARGAGAGSHGGRRQPLREPRGPEGSVQSLSLAATASLGREEELGCRDELLSSSCTSHSSSFFLEMWMSRCI